MNRDWIRVVQAQIPAGGRRVRIGQGTTQWLPLVLPRKINVACLGRKETDSRAERDCAWNQKSWV